MTESRSPACDSVPNASDDWTVRISDAMRQSLPIRFSDFLSPEGSRFRTLHFGGRLWIACKDIKDEAKRCGGVIAVTPETVRELCRRNQTTVDGQSVDRHFVLGKDIQAYFSELTPDLKRVMATAGYMTEYASRDIVSLFFHLARSINPKSASDRICAVCMEQLSSERTIIARLESKHDDGFLGRRSTDEAGLRVSQLQERSVVIERRVLRLEKANRLLIRIIAHLAQSNALSGYEMQTRALKAEELLKEVFSGEEHSR